MTDLEITVGLFPGQGGYRRGALHDAWSRGDRSVLEVIAAVDDAAGAVVGTDLGTRIFGRGAPAPEDLFLDDPEILQLAAFAVSVATHRLLCERGARFSVLVGHSLGEVAALVASGALGLRDGADLLCRLVVAARRGTGSGPTGGMTSLRCSADRARQVLDLIDDPALALAVVDGPRQVVVSGPIDGLARVDAVAEIVGIGADRLLAPAALHGPSMEAVRAEVLSRLPTYWTGPLGTPVFSPILGRYYRDGDDLAEMVSQHLVLPVRFDTTLERLHATGARVFVELGAGTTFTAVVRSTYEDCATYAPLSPSDEPADLDRVASMLRPPSTQATPQAMPSTLPTSQTPQSTSTTGSSPQSTLPTPPPSPSTLTTPQSLHPMPSTPSTSTTERSMLSTPSTPQSTLTTSSTSPSTLTRPQTSHPMPSDPSTLTTAGSIPSTLSTPSWALMGSPSDPSMSSAAGSQVDIPSVAAESGSGGCGDVFGTIRRIYAETLEYPEEVFTDNALLEADLGLDSVKRTELLAVLNDHFQLGPPWEGLRTSDYETFGSVVRLVQSLVDEGRLVAS